MKNNDEKYYDLEGNEVSLNKLVRLEPDWASNVIRHLKQQLKEKDLYIEKLQKWADVRKT